MHQYSNGRYAPVLQFFYKNGELLWPYASTDLRSAGHPLGDRFVEKCGKRNFLVPQTLRCFEIPPPP